MSLAHPLDALATVPGVADTERRAAHAIAAVHRRPVNLRQSDLTSSEAAVRGMQLSALISGLAEQQELAAYSLLAPAQLQATARTFQRAPLQIFARIDALLGGPGTPLSGVPRLQALAQLIAGKPHPRTGLLPALVGVEVEGGEFFGPRSGSVARVAARITAVMTGFDPRGLAVPEVWLHRHRDQRDVVSLLTAWEHGATEAEGIARAAM